MTLGGSQTRFWGRLARGEYSEEGQTWFFHWNLGSSGPFPFPFWLLILLLFLKIQLALMKDILKGIQEACAKKKHML